MNHEQETQLSVHSGRSVWMSKFKTAPQYAPLESTIKCDVAVIGSGITGALVSYLLIQSGVDTVILDQGIVGAGSTASSTGLLQYEVDTPLVKLIPMVGEKSAVRAYRRGLEAIDRLESICDVLGPECEFERRSSLYLASRAEDLCFLANEHECRKAFGFNVQLLSSDALRDWCGMRSNGAILSTGDAQVNPLQLTQSLIKAAAKGGARIFGGTRVEQVKENDSGGTAITSMGRVDARIIVYCTGYFAQPTLPPTDSNLNTTYVVASHPALRDIPRWPDQCLIWETAEPYLYLRRTREGHVIIGGEDTPLEGDHKNARLLKSKAGQLKSRFERMFPETPFDTEYVWAGVFAETQDGLPMIGHVPGSRHLLHAFGYGGNGITFSMIAAELILSRFAEITKHLCVGVC